MKWTKAQVDLVTQWKKTAAVGNLGVWSMVAKWLFSCLINSVQNRLVQRVCAQLRLPWWNCGHMSKSIYTSSSAKKTGTEHKSITLPERWVPKSTVLKWWCIPEKCKCPNNQTPDSAFTVKWNTHINTGTELAKSIRKQHHWQNITAYLIKDLQIILFFKSCNAIILCDWNWWSFLQ